MQHIKELVHPELLGQETKTEGATVQFTPVINAKPASVFSYCINLGGISQERDFEESESLLFSAVNKFCENADAQCAHRRRFSD